MANGTTHNPTRNVASSLVAWAHAISQKEGDRAGVIGDDLVAEPVGFKLTLLVSCERAERLMERKEKIGVVV